ncbi:unnamed protein product [Boreogadus saida]
MREKHITMTTGRMGVPDLVFVRGADLLVVDVTVRFDGNEGWLAKAREEKLYLILTADDRLSPYCELSDHYPLPCAGE